jgi:hypothetical protein
MDQFILKSYHKRLINATVDDVGARAAAATHDDDGGGGGGGDGGDGGNVGMKCTFQ